MHHSLATNGALRRGIYNAANHSRTQHNFYGWFDGVRRFPQYYTRALRHIYNKAKSDLPNRIVIVRFVGPAFLLAAVRRTALGLLTGGGGFVIRFLDVGFGEK